MQPLRLGAVLLAFTATTAFGQQAISARSGMIHYIEGKVFAGDQQIDEKFGTFPQVKENQVLRTTEGRAEVLLTPGVFIRVGENSSFRMITNRLIDTRLEFLSGSMILESEDVLKDNAVTIVAKDATVHLHKAGIYRFDNEPAQLRVFKGVLDVEAQGKNIELREGKLLHLSGDMAMEKFDPKEGDALSNWSYRRAREVAMANVSAAKSFRDSGGYMGSTPYDLGYGGTYPCLSMTSSLWAYNPYFGMYTYLPCSGRLFSPYGFAYWSPATVNRVYYQHPGYTHPTYGTTSSGYGADRGYSTFSPSSSGYSTAVSAASSSTSGMSVSHAPSGGGAMGGGGSVSRGGGGGGGGHR